MEPIKPYYSCPSCGGELAWNEKEAVYVCRFCRMAYTSQRLQPAEPPAPHKEGRQPVWQGSELWESSRIPSPKFEDACAHTIGDTVGAAAFSGERPAGSGVGAAAGVPSQAQGESPEIPGQREQPAFSGGWEQAPGQGVQTDSFEDSQDEEPFEEDVQPVREDWQEQERRRQSFFEKVSVMQCPDCGVQLIRAKGDPSRRCYYCGAQMAQLPGNGMPRHTEWYLPFTVSRHQAQQEFRRFRRRHFPLPLSFWRPGVIRELEPVYLPFWIARWELRETFSAVVQRRRQSDGTLVCFEEALKGESFFEAPLMPLDGENRRILQGVWPFSLENLREFRPEDLAAGQVAELSDPDEQELTQRTRWDRASAAQRLLRQELGEAESVQVRGHQQRRKQMVYRCVLLPVWILHKEEAGRSMVFAVNGETGTVLEEVPLFWWQTALVFVVCFLLFLLGFLGLGGLLWQ